MAFNYYKKLSSSQKKIYDRSNAITSIKLPWAEKFAPFMQALKSALLEENQKKVQELSQRILNGFCQVFQISGVQVKVLSKRPSAHWGELHGLYEREEGKKPKITLWMRTAKRQQVVAFKTYLRTLLHELGHHLDYTLLALPDSLHTEGFYQRESSLFQQLPLSK